MTHKSKPLLGIGLIILGIFVAGYVGLYLCLYGGIVQVVSGIKADWAAGQIAIGVIRIVCMGLAGGISFMLFFIPGKVLLSE